MTETVPTWRLREELRREAEEHIRGREAFERHVGRLSDKPLPKIQLDPREVLQLLDDARAQRVADLWHANNGWIPGADRERLQSILDIHLDPPNAGKCDPAGNIPLG